MTKRISGIILDKAAVDIILSRNISCEIGIIQQLSSQQKVLIPFFDKELYQNNIPTDLFGNSLPDIANPCNQCIQFFSTSKTHNYGKTEFSPHPHFIMGLAKVRSYAVVTGTLINPKSLTAHDTCAHMIVQCWDAITFMSPITDILVN